MQARLPESGKGRVESRSGNLDEGSCVLLDEPRESERNRRVWRRRGSLYTCLSDKPSQGAERFLVRSLQTVPRGFCLVEEVGETFLGGTTYRWQADTRWDLPSNDLPGQERTFPECKLTGPLRHSSVTQDSSSVFPSPVLPPRLSCLADGTGGSGPL